MLTKQSETDAKPSLKALRGSDVFGPGSKTGLSRSEIYRMIGRNEFPPGFLVARNCRAWFEHEVDHWLLERARRTPANKMPEQLARGQRSALAAKAMSPEREVA